MRAEAPTLSASLRGACQRIATRALKVSGATWVTVQLYDAERHRFRVVALAPPDGAQVDRALGEVAERFAGWDVRGLEAPPEVNRVHLGLYDGRTVAAAFAEVEALVNAWQHARPSEVVVGLGLGGIELRLPLDGAAAED